MRLTSVGKFLILDVGERRQTEKQVSFPLLLKGFHRMTHLRIAHQGVGFGQAASGRAQIPNHLASFIDGVEKGEGL
jgi:hypothetical protein